MSCAISRSNTMASTRSTIAAVSLYIILTVAGVLSASADEPQAIELGGRRELFVDEFLIEKRDAVELRLHAPTPREIVLVCDAPWEGSGCGYETIFRDG